MREYTFLFKEKDTDDRDCVHYIELEDLKNKHICCDGKFNVHGACFSGSLKGNIPYEEIKTILTKEEYELLCSPDKEVDYTEIIRKLESEENRKLFEEIQAEEVEYLMEEYGLDEEDVEQIFDEYYLDYRDRGIIGYVFKDCYELGYEEADAFGYVDNKNPTIERYFDFEKFGEDLLDGEQYMQLADGRCVYLNY